MATMFVEAGGENVEELVGVGLGHLNVGVQEIGELEFNVVIERVPVIRGSFSARGRGVSVS